MNIEKVLLSYPRSGNHMVRFFLELLSEQPTMGAVNVKTNQISASDKPIYTNKFRENIPFNISKYNQVDCFYKHHQPPNKSNNVKQLIFIVRNPQEVLIRHSYNKLNLNLYQDYFDIIDYYNNFKGEKLLLFYEDIFKDKELLINELYTFLKLENEEKKQYIIKNAEKLSELSKSPTDRKWEKPISNSVEFHYKRIPEKIKTQYDEYIAKKMMNPSYKFIKDKYNL